MSDRVVFTARARADALEGFRWIAEQSEQAAAKWYAGLERALDKLKEHPERHPIAAEESEQFEMTLRRMLYGKRRGVYRILFSIEGETVVLHHIRHGARGPIETENGNLPAFLRQNAALLRFFSGRTIPPLLERPVDSAVQSQAGL